VKFLVDAQLSVRLGRLLADVGHDVLHTSALATGNRTPDEVLAQLADGDDRVVVTKDGDFEISHTLRNTPRRLLLVTTGNISNDKLIALFQDNQALITAALESSAYVEVSSDAVIVHGDIPRP
jgi:predicted nuclease of predicted toxin-antitoxin system